MLISTHLLEELGPVCEYGVVVREGRGLAEGFKRGLARVVEPGGGSEELGWSDIYFRLGG